MADKPNKAQVGKVGEDTACKWLKSKGYIIVERNYWKKWGEIDIVANKAGILHFVEVKAVSRSLRSSTPKLEDEYHAEENVHPWKLQRLSRVIQTYLLERKIDDEQAWQIDVLTVELDFDTRRALVKLLPDIKV